LLVRVLVLAANRSEEDGLKRLLRRVPLYDRWKRILADAGYDNAALVHYCQSWFAVELILPPTEAQPAGRKSFVPQPVRWVVERTFAWLGKYRRLSKDYEALPQVSEAFIYLANIHILLRRLAPSASF
jgi:putative transposase